LTCPRSHKLEGCKQLGSYFTSSRPKEITKLDEQALALAARGRYCQYINHEAAEVGVLWGEVYPITYDVVLRVLRFGSLRLVLAQLLKLVDVVVLVGVVIGDSVNCIINVALFVRSAASCKRLRWLVFTPK
jgi:hypothetical protein